MNSKEVLKGQVGAVGLKDFVGAKDVQRWSGVASSAGSKGYRGEQVARKLLMVRAV